MSSDEETRRVAADSTRQHPESTTGGQPRSDHAPRSAQRGSLGAGSESSMGEHSASGRDESDASATGDRQFGRANANDATGDATGSDDRSGSEPLERDREHRPSYGGEGGEPRTSSDQRE
jgi:hypothetical protein